jgi:hypothetical protein
MYERNGKLDGMRIVKGKRSTPIKPAPAPLGLLKIPYELL